MKRNIFKFWISTSISQTVDSSDKAMAMIGNAVKKHWKDCKILIVNMIKSLKKLEYLLWVGRDFHKINSMNIDVYSENEIMGTWECKESVI